MHAPEAITTGCWVISDGAAGNESQALALARALDLDARRVRIRIAQPWRAFAPRLTWHALRAIRDDAAAVLAPPWPAIAIGCGRHAALAVRVLRAQAAGSCFAVQILDPRIDSAAFDAVIAPQHDRAQGAHVIRSIGALNGVDGQWLGEGRARFAQFGALPAPRTAVLIGGSNRAQKLDRAYFEALIERLAEQGRADGGSFLVSLSRRTPPEHVAFLRAAFARFAGAFWTGEADGDNPYVGFLAWADRIVVTPDSVNMLSEAAATGRPVYTFATRPIVGKLAAFHAELRASGHLRLLDDALAGSLADAAPPPLAETAAIAELLRARIPPRLLAAARR